MIKPAIFETVIEKIDSLKKKSHIRLSNLFSYDDALRDMLLKKKCFYYADENNVFLLIPYHGKYYDLLFVSSGTDSLKKAVDRFLSGYDADFLLRLSIIGKESYTEELVSIFRDRGFHLLKKLARTRFSEKEKDLKVDLDLLSLKRKETLTPSPYPISFAEEGDEKGVLSLLEEEFDYCADNIPEEGVIADNIRKRQIVVIKDQGKIIGCHYFEIKNGIFYGWYDVIKREYRKEFLYQYIEAFEKSPVFLTGINSKLNRRYGWRDAANKKLMRYSLKTGWIPDGVYICNMVYDKNKKD